MDELTALAGSFSVSCTVTYVLQYTAKATAAYSCGRHAIRGHWGSDKHLGDLVFERAAIASWFPRGGRLPRKLAKSFLSSRHTRIVFCELSFVFWT
jgi:hypothetical protein